MRFPYIIILLFLTACTGSTFFRENSEIDSGGWEKSKPATFSVHIDNNKAGFNSFVIIRHSTLYKYNNLWLFIHICDPNGNKKTDTVECILSDNSGKWYGSGLGDFKSLKLSYRQNVTFPDTGIYMFSIEHAMRDEPLEYISDVGLTLETIQ